MPISLWLKHGVQAAAAQAGVVVLQLHTDQVEQEALEVHTLTVYSKHLISAPLKLSRLVLGVLAVQQFQLMTPMETLDQRVATPRLAPN